VPTSTRTHVQLFDSGMVDESVGGAFRTLETDYLKRKDFMSKESQSACEARLDLLRRTWQLLLDPDFT